MTVEFRTISFSASGITGGPYIESQKTSQFPGQIQNAEACIKSWKIKYSQGGRPFKEASIEVRNVWVSGEQVSVEVSAGICDDSGYWDDAYDIEVTVLVIANVPGY